MRFLASFLCKKNIVFWFGMVREPSTNFVVINYKVFCMFASVFSTLSTIDIVTCFQSTACRELNVINSMLGSDKKWHSVQQTTSRADACCARPASAVRPRPRTCAHHAAPAPLRGHARQLEASPTSLWPRVWLPGAWLLTPETSPQPGLIDQLLGRRRVQCRRFSSWRFRLRCWHPRWSGPAEKENQFR